MKTRSPFVPAAPVYACLEERIAPANIFGLGTWWDHRMADLGISHYKHHAASSSNVGLATPAGATAVAKHAHAAAKVQTTALFK